MGESSQTTEPLHALLVTSLAAFLTPFMLGSIGLAIPSIGSEFNADAPTLNLIVTVFLIFMASFLLPFGRLADLYGRKKIFLTGIISYSFFSFLSALAPSALTLIVTYSLQGVSGAMVSSTGVAILTSTYQVKERGKILGINATAVYTGLSTGPFLGGLLTYNFGWRSIFFVNVLVGLIALVVASVKLKGEWVGTVGEKFDFGGSVLIVLSLSGLIYGVSTFSLSDSSKMLFFLGLGGLVAFLFHERSAQFPILNVRVFSSNPAFTLSNLAALIHYSATFAIGFLLSLYLQVARGLNPQEAGLILLIQPLMMVFVSPLAGRISDRVEPRIVASVGMALTSVGLFIFSLLSPQSSLNLIMTNLFLIGLGYGLFSSPNTYAVMSSVSIVYYGVASSTLGTMRFLGQASSMAIVSTVFSFYLKDLMITSAVTDLLVQSVSVVFLILAIVSVGGIFASLARGAIHES
jgi:EmrB/QacA subfamily drug resistance transporter